MTDLDDRYERMKDKYPETVLCTHCEVTYTIRYRDMVLVSMIDEYGQELLGEE